MKKYLFLSLVVLALILSVSITFAQDDGPRIALFNPLGNNEYVRNAELGVRSIVEAAGGTVEAFDAGFNPEEQLNQINDAITSGGFDAFIIYSVDGAGVTVGVDAAAEAGIPVISLDAPINTDRRTLVPYKNVAGQIARTGVGDGEQIGRAIVMACEGIDPCEVAFLIGFQGFPLDLDRLEAIQGIIADYPNIAITTVQEASYLEDVGYEVSTDILQANPGIDVFASVGDQMTLGSELAVEDAGLVGQVKLIGNGASQDGYTAVAEGRWFATIANLPFTNGQIAGQMALQAISGELIVRSVNMYDQSPPIPSSGAVITQENVAEFEPQW
ncbi:MAG: sugar ABC transporter substrate-binding protein [Anaerolineae bacterium]|nr:sugar ABC transporter substrate-binding protein [Anaerolineae bacterium]